MRALALIAVAAAIFTGVAGADSLPGTKTAKDRADWRAILHWPTGCEKDWHLAGNTSAAGIVLHASAGGRRLVEVSCYLGAYQGTAMLYLVRPAFRPAGPLTLQIYVDPGSGVPTARTTTRLLGVLSFTPRTGQLVVFDKARGIGDCGIYSVFKLTGNRFVPTVARAKTKCDGKPPFDPRRWPKLPLP